MFYYFASNSVFYVQNPHAVTNLIHSPTRTFLLKSHIVFPTCVAFPQSENKSIQLYMSNVLQKIYITSRYLGQIRNSISQGIKTVAKASDWPISNLGKRKKDDVYDAH